MSMIINNENENENIHWLISQNHKWASPFLQPVDPDALGIPDYFDIIKNPMDLGTILANVENHVLQTREDFAAQVRLVFNNALLYNKPQDDVYVDLVDDCQ